MSETYLNVAAAVLQFCTLLSGVMLMIFSGMMQYRTFGEFRNFKTFSYI